MNCNLSDLIFLPLTLRSTMTSFIIPSASVVLASSKNNTVQTFNCSFCEAISSAFSTFFTISSYVVPPWTYESRSSNPFFKRYFHWSLNASCPLSLLRNLTPGSFQRYLSHTENYASIFIQSIFFWNAGAPFVMKLRSETST